MNGKELVEMGFSPEECIAVMVAVNSHGREIEGRDIFDEASMGRVLAAAKEQESVVRERAEREQEEIEKQAEEEMERIKMEEGEEQFEEQEYPDKPITDGLLGKGVTIKGKEKPPLNKVTLISLEERQITRISEMEKVANIANLHLGHNRITRLENFTPLSKLKILKLESNNITKI